MENFRKSSGLKRRVLVVDDEEVNCEILGNILRDRYEVDYAHDGREAFGMLKNASPQYSLILLDLLIPKMDGFELIKVCRGSSGLKNIPIIVMTSEKEAEVKSINLGAVDFITKPYDIPEVILARCERIIELSRSFPSDK
ncbi:MAG: response regulator [Lachnospiraceae bacterium]|nr:response regulator [Lachnospiraceae bacterium]